MRKIWAEARRMFKVSGGVITKFPARADYAPDLLEALKGALSVIDRAGVIWLGENNAHAAIARAEGRS